MSKNIIITLTDKLKEHFKQRELEKVSKQIKLMGETEKFVYHFFYDEERERHYWKEVTKENLHELEIYKSIWSLNYSTRVIELEHKHFLDYLKNYDYTKDKAEVYQNGIGAMTWGIDFNCFMSNYNKLSTYIYKIK